MNNIKTFLTFLFTGVTVLSFTQNLPIDVNQGSNFKIAIAPTVGYIGFNQTVYGHNINNAFFGGQFVHQKTRY